MKRVRRAITIAALALSVFLISSVGDESRSSSQMYLTVVGK